MHTGHDFDLVHPGDELVDIFLAVAKVTTFNEVLEFARTESSSRVGELEWPKEVIDLLEIGSNSVDLVDNIFHANNAILAKVLLNDGIVRQWNTLLIAVNCISGETYKMIVKPPTSCHIRAYRSVREPS